MYKPSLLLLPLPPFQNLAAGQRAVLNVPCGPTYWLPTLDLRDAAGVAATKAEIIAGITSVRLTVNGKEKWFGSGADMVMLAEFKNAGCVAAGQLPLYFADVSAEIEAVGAGERIEGGHINQDGPAWGTAGLNSFQIEVVFAAGAPGAEVINAQVLAIETEPTELGAHVVLHRQTRSFAGTGTDRIIDCPKGMGSSGQNLICKAIHIADANIGQIELLADRSRLLYCTREFLHQQYVVAQAGRRRTPQTGWTHIDFAGLRNRVADALTMSMRDIELALTFTVAPADYDIIYEMVDVHPAAR